MLAFCANIAPPNCAPYRYMDYHGCCTSDFLATNPVCVPAPPGVFLRSPARSAGGGASERRGALAEPRAERGGAGVRATRSAATRSEDVLPPTRAERGEPMPDRLRVRRRSLNAPRGRRSLPGCLWRRGLQPADLPAAFERRAGVRATRGAQSDEDICARHRRYATMSSASFAFPEGARHKRRVNAEEAKNAGPQPSPPPAVPVLVLIWRANGAKVEGPFSSGVNTAPQPFPNLITGSY